MVGYFGCVQKILWFWLFLGNVSELKQYDLKREKVADSSLFRFLIQERLALVGLFFNVFGTAEATFLKTRFKL